MGRLNRLLLAVALIASCAVPVVAQGYSDGFNFLKGVRARDANAVQALLANPSSTVVNTRDAASGEGALHILVRGRDLTWVNFMLGRGARPDIQSNDGATPLTLATQLGWREGAEALLARGANPNLGNRSGETPLILAVQRRDLGMVRMLLARRADPNQTDNLSGYSAIDYARQDPRAAPILRELQQARPAATGPVSGPPRQ